MYVIFTDSDTDITPEIASRYGYNIISMPFTFGGKEIYPYEGEYKNFDCKKFYDDLRASGELPKTSSISPQKYKDYFEPFFKQGKDILYAHFSSEMSGTFTAMNMALSELKEVYPERKFYAVDTRAITMGALNIVEQIGEMYLKGKSPEEIVEWAKDGIYHTATYYFADDLKYLRRSGRVKSISAIVGNLMGIRPIINIGSDGIMRSIDKVKGQKAVISRLLYYVDELGDDVQNHRIIVAHSDIPELVDLLIEKLKERYGNNLDIETVLLNPTAGCHAGPNCVGLSFHAKRREISLPADSE